jgi:nitronate monooxygenase
MGQWPDRRILDLLGIELPILQAPMSGFSTVEMAVAVSQAGGLGALACAQLSVSQAEDELISFRQSTNRPINLNFFCHRALPANPVAMAAWRKRLRGYFDELGLDPDAEPLAASRLPFDEAYCALVERHRPEIVSFHFGLPQAGLLARVKATGARVLSSATTVAEAVWLEEQGVDAVIAMGAEAGGHRGSFLAQDMNAQPGTFALVPQVADAVRVPVIAAGGIADARGVVAALALGASAVQVGTAFLFCPEAKISDVHRRALDTAADDNTQITNVLTGRPARGLTNRLMREVGPISSLAPAFPTAAGPLAPLKAKAEAAGFGNFSSLWAGQSARLAPHLPAAELTRRMASEALDRLSA